MWTEEAIEALTKLALEGKSAAWIAAALGAPSRNAVIGKAHRIGIKLNGWRTGPARERAAVERPQPTEIPKLRPAPRPRSARPPVPREQKREPSWVFAEAEVGIMRRIGFEAIRASECRWPVGDPRQEDFAYCGLEAAKGQSYCAGHCRVAYRPPKGRAPDAPHTGPWGAKRLESVRSPDSGAGRAANEARWDGSANRAKERTGVGSGLFEDFAAACK